MRVLLLLSALAVGAFSADARAYDFMPGTPLDVKDVDPAMLTDLYGAWEIRSANGKRRCRVTLLKEPGIGGNQIEVAPSCKAAFPVMEDITAWRLLESWTIDFVDPLRKTRLRFQTPDERYVAFGDAKDVAGMDEFVKLPDKPARKR